MFVFFTYVYRYITSVKIKVAFGNSKRYDMLFNKWSWSHAFGQKYQAIFDAKRSKILMLKINESTKEQALEFCRKGLIPRGENPTRKDLSFWLHRNFKLLNRKYHHKIKIKTMCQGKYT